MSRPALLGLALWAGLVLQAGCGGDVDAAAATGGGAGAAGAAGAAGQAGSAGAGGSGGASGSGGMAGTAGAGGAGPSIACVNAVAGSCTPAGTWDLLYTKLYGCSMFKGDDRMIVTEDAGQLCFELDDTVWSVQHTITSLSVDASGCGFSIEISDSLSNPSETYQQGMTLALSFGSTDEITGKLTYDLSGGSNCSVADADVFGRRSGSAGSSCDPLAQADCAEGFGCYSIMGAAPSCRPAGSGMGGTTCTRDDDCTAGATCAAPYSCGTPFVCRAVCDPAGAPVCLPDETCTASGEWGACIPSVCL